MNTLSIVIKQFATALQRLQDALAQDKNEFMRDSAIQRFEFTFDLSWKAIKRYLEENEAIVCTSPKQCLREAFKQGLIEYDNFWIELADARNQTSHSYNEELADEIYDMLPKAAEYFDSLRKKLA